MKRTFRIATATNPADQEELKEGCFIGFELFIEASIQQDEQSNLFSSVSGDELRLEMPVRRSEEKSSVGPTVPSSLRVKRKLIRCADDVLFSMIATQRKEARRRPIPSGKGWLQQEGRKG